MPTVLIWRGYRFYFYSNEGNEPPHIHVSKDGCQAKFWLKDGSLDYNDDSKHNDLKKIHKIVTEHRKAFLEKWHDYIKHGH